MARGTDRGNGEPEWWLTLLRNALRGTNYGEVRLIIHSGAVVEVQHEQRVRR